MCILQCPHYVGILTFAAGSPVQWVGLIILCDNIFLSISCSLSFMKEPTWNEGKKILLKSFSSFNGPEYCCYILYSADASLHIVDFLGSKISCVAFISSGQNVLVFISKQTLTPTILYLEIFLTTWHSSA